METKDLKLTSASYVMESEISKPAKLQMLNFIQNEATEHQLMALLLDGEIVDLDEQAEQVVEDRFLVSEVILGVVGEELANVVMKCSIKCKKITDKKERKLCGLNCLILASSAGIKKAKQQLALCSSEENPGKCKIKMMKYIKKLELDIQKAKQKIIKYR